MRSPHRISPGAVQVLVNGRVPLYSRCCRRLYSRTVFQEGDVVSMTRRSRGADAKPTTVIAGPLVSGGKAVVPGKKMRGLFSKSKDGVEMNDIIGKGPRDFTRSTKGEDYILNDPTLAEYTTFSPRLVTPIYPQDASLIVNLLDIHPGTPGADNGETFEIFEAGTGHGSLTLHLARAIYGANTPAPLPPSSPTVSGSDGEDPFEQWRANRRAVIHTLDNSPGHSAHAEKLIRAFRRGMYAPHIDFHVGGIENYLQSRLASNGHQPFLSRAILDLPSTHLYLGIVGEALNPFGKLVTWNPSITQTIKCLQVVEEQDLPFVLETVLEVGSGSGGREWDVRSVLPRAIQNSVTSVSEVLEVLEGASEEASGDEVGNAEVVQATNTPDFEPTHSKSSSGWETICRPKVGLKVEGGGFIGLWRRKYFRDKVPCTS